MTLLGSKMLRRRSRISTVELRNEGLKPSKQEALGLRPMSSPSGDKVLDGKFFHYGEKGHCKNNCPKFLNYKTSLK